MDDLDKIVFENKYYPAGLTKRNLSDYYMSNMSSILDECKGRPVVLFISFDPKRKLVVQRNIDNKPIRLNKTVYEKIFSTGNIVSISAEILDLTNFWVIDIDSKTVTNEKRKIQAVEKVLKTTTPFVKTHKVYNSTSGFHVYGFLSKKVVKTTQKMMLEKLLETQLGEYCLIDNQKLYDDVENSDINLDMSPMNTRGSILVPGALSRDGIICSDVTKTYGNWNIRKGIIST